MRRLTFALCAAPAMLALPTAALAADGVAATDAPVVAAPTNGKSQLTGSLATALQDYRVAQSGADVLWEQLPNPDGPAFVDQDFDPDFLDFSTFMAQDVVFDGPVNISSVTTFFTNFNSTWPLNADGTARLNIFTDPLGGGDDPSAGPLVPAFYAVGANGIEVTASGLDIDLPAGTYWIGLTPVLEFGVYGQEFHQQALDFLGIATMARNPLGGFGVGTDWIDAGLTFGGIENWDSAIRITGSAADDCVCPEDIDRDGQVAFSDILRILGVWGPCSENACDTPGVCGQYTQCGVGEPFDCICWTTFDGEGVCYQDFFCDAADCPDGNCPPGFVCVVGSCCGTNKCAPTIKCDEQAAPLQGSGLTGGGNFIEPDDGVTSFGAVADLVGPSRPAGEGLGTGNGRVFESAPTVVNEALVARSGGVNPVGPFVGEISESWEGFQNYLDNPNTYETSPATIFGGAAQISNPLMAVYEPGVASFGLGNAGSAQVADGRKGMGLDGSPETASIVFADPVSAFGAFWGAATGDPFGDPTLVDVQFFDETGGLIDQVRFPYTRPGDGVLEWHGWESPVPVKGIRYTGGFVVIDAMQANGVVNPCGPCPEDIDRDGVVAFSDILRVLGAWGPCTENACDNPGTCSTGFEQCGVGEPFDCFCWTTFNGEGVCYQNFLCNDVTDCPDGNCPPGFVCVVQSCCEVNKCVPMIKCDEQAAPLEGSGLTGSGIFIEP